MQQNTSRDYARKRGTKTELIRRIEARISGFNLRSLTLDDLNFECERRGIIADGIPLAAIHGYSMCDDDGAAMIINSLLSQPEQIIAGFHELTHLIDQADDPGIFLSNGNLWNRAREERDANIIGVIALMPDREVAGLSACDIMERWQVSRAVAEFRLSLMK